MIRLIIVDDEILSRVGIQSFFDGEEDIHVLGTFGMASDAIEFLRTNPVDIVVTDIEMADIDGLEFIRIIREDSLANGVIIVSCHNDFSYAQEAIEKGTNSYILKHNISKDALLEEVRRVYKKTYTGERTLSSEQALFSMNKEIEKGEIYRLAIIKINSRDMKIGGHNIEGSMLVHLLESIIARYQMGTLFAPYGKEIFAIFHFDKIIGFEARKRQLEENIQAVEKNMVQYLNESMSFGISREFSDLQEVPARYDEAVQATNHSFYTPEVTVFYADHLKSDFSIPHFSWQGFLDKNGMSTFVKELERVLSTAAMEKWNIALLKNQLVQNVGILLYTVTTEFNVGEQFEHEWNSDQTLVQSISAAASIAEMKQVIISIVYRFRSDCTDEIDRDELASAFSYIEQHLSEKITLNDLTDLCHMSAPSFCKKFKERTGKTLVQYLNTRRIEKAKGLMKNRKYSLWDISEMTGFSNANYMIRVFKKITEQTVSEYRRQFGIIESEEERS